MNQNELFNLTISSKDLRLIALQTDICDINIKKSFTDEIKLKVVFYANPDFAETFTERETLGSIRLNEDERGILYELLDSDLSAVYDVDRLPKTDIIAEIPIGVKLHI